MTHAPALPLRSDQSWHPGGQFVHVPDFGRIHVVRVARTAARADPQTPTILLIHGYMQSSWAWRHNLDALSAGFDVLAACVPGFGWSDKPRDASYRLADQARRLFTLLDQLVVGRVDLIGNSLGGALALRMALQQPGRVGKLVLVNPAGKGMYPMAALASLQHELAEPLLHLPGVPTLLGLGLKHGAYAGLDVDADFLRAFLLPLQTPGAKRAALRIARHFNRDLADVDAQLGQVRQPVLLLWGQGDRVVPLRAVQRMARALPDARLELYDCSGHCPMEEEPRRFNREALAFLSASPDTEAST